MRFLRRHKIPVIIISVVVVLLSVVIGTGVHYLNKISYENGDELIAAPTGDSQDGNDDFFNDGSLSDEEAAKLADADENIRKNLDNSKVWYSDDVFNILLMGIDYGSKRYPYGRSDSMILVSINRKQRDIKLASLSRAAYAAIKGYENTRLSHAHGYGGPALAIDTIQRNYKIRIDRYVRTDFDSFKKIIDAFSGIDITLTSQEAKALSRGFPGKFPSAGTYHLNGEQALVYARTRDIDTDRARTGRQRNVLLALSQKVKNMSLSEAFDVLNAVLPLVKTNFTRAELVRQAASAMQYLKWDVTQYILPHIAPGLVLRGEYEVILVDWADEVAYVHDLLYKGVEVKYE